MLRGAVIGIVAFSIVAGVPLTSLTPVDAAAPPSWQPVLADADIAVLRADPTNPSRIYAGGARLVKDTKDPQRTFAIASVFRSDDAGANWTSRDLDAPFSDIDDLAIDPTQPKTLYASGASGSVFKSIDGGATWTAQKTGIPHELHDLAVDPSNSAVVYVAAGTEGLLKSTDAGKTYQKVSFANEFCDVGSVALGPQGIVYVGGGCGIYKSNDAGVTWHKLDELPSVVLDIAIDPADPNRVFVGAGPTISRKEVGGVWQSTDGGTSWTKLGNTGERAETVLVDPHNSQTLYTTSWFEFGQESPLSAGRHILWSRNGGETWAEISGAAPADDLFALLVVDGTLFVGGHGGIWRLDLPRPTPHDERYFPQTGFRIDDDTIWDYFTHRGGVNTFGYPISRTFRFQGFTVQFFQRRIIQLDQQGKARLLNVLDPGLLPYTQINGATFPGYDAGLVATAPDVRDQAATLGFVEAHVPDTFQGVPVNFFRTFQDTVSASVAFPDGGNDALLPGINLELWGVPTSQPVVDPKNHDFVYQRFQRGIMMYRASCECTEGVLLGDYLKGVLIGQNLPPDLEEAARESPLYRQYDASKPKWVRDPNLLPETDLAEAFTPQ